METALSIVATAQRDLSSWAAAQLRGNIAYDEWLNVKETIPPSITILAFRFESETGEMLQHSLLRLEERVRHPIRLPKM